MTENNTVYHDYAVEQIEKLISIDSPTGYHYNVAAYLQEELENMGFEVRTLRKGGVIANLGGEGNPLMMMAHVDTLGAFVHYIKGAEDLPFPTERSIRIILKRKMFVF